METAVKCGKVVATLGEVVFAADFDSGNLDRAEECESSSRDGLEYNLWLASDCAGTEFQNANRTWFHFSVSIPAGLNRKAMRFNIQNMNKQSRLYHQGLTPIVKVVPGKGSWERLRENVECKMCDENLKLSFTYIVAESRKHTVFFAFCFPFSYAECQKKLTTLSQKFSCPCSTGSGRCPDDHAIYYHWEHLCHSLEGRRVDFITVSSHHNMRNDREPGFPGLFPDIATEPRPRVFDGKKVVFITSRVHPGETPSSHVFNGFLSFLLRTDDPRSRMLRQHFVFKLVPILNPDGVFRGHYRTDSRGINLNRVYLNPDQQLHPSIFAVKQLFMYYHTVTASRGDHLFDGTSKVQSNGNCGGYDVLSQIQASSVPSASDQRCVTSCGSSGTVIADGPLVTNGTTFKSEKQIHLWAAALPGTKGNIMDSLKCTIPPSSTSSIITSPLFSSTSSISSAPSVSSSSTAISSSLLITSTSSPVISTSFPIMSTSTSITSASCPIASTSSLLTSTSSLITSTPSLITSTSSLITSTSCLMTAPSLNCSSGIALYVDLHAHATKRGCFLYGNHFDDETQHAESMLFPRLMSLNSTHVDFDHCVFSEKNMYAADKRTGQSKEGSGRVALYQATGVLHSYTLECNYNSGRRCNGKVPTTTANDGRVSPSELPSLFPHKYSIDDFEEVGRSLGVALLDLYSLNPMSRLPNTEFGSLDAVRASLVEKVKAIRAKAEASKADLTKVCAVSGDEADLSQKGRLLTEDSPSISTGEWDQLPKESGCPCSALCVNPSLVKRTLNGKKIEERRQELRRQIRVAKVCQRIPPSGLSSPLVPPASCKGVAVMDIQLPTQGVPGVPANDDVMFAGDKCKEKKAFWVSLGTTKPRKKKQNIDNSLSVTGVRVAKEHIAEKCVPRKQLPKLLPRRGSEKNAKIEMAVHLPSRAFSDGDLK